MDVCKAIEDMIREQREEGKIEGKIEILSHLVQEGVISMQEAAQRINMTEEAFRRKMK